MITKSDYVHYLEARKALAQAEQLFEPIAKAIAKALRGHDAVRFYYSDTKVLYSCDTVGGGNTIEPDGDFPAELLTDPDWKERVAFMVVSRDLRHEQWRARCAAAAQQAEQERDLAELKRLQEKYPLQKGER